MSGIRLTPGLHGEKTRAVLDAVYWEALNVAALVERLGMPRDRVWPLLKHLKEWGYVERPARGQYIATSAGRTALHARITPKPEPVRSGERITPPKRGWRWTPARRAWLARHYAVLGAKRCAALLHREMAVVHAQATRMGLSWGQDLEGYTLLTDLARLTGLPYIGLYSRSKRAGVLTFPVSVTDLHARKTRQRRRKALVPDAWADALLAERGLPEPGEERLDHLRARLGISQTHLQRLTRGQTVLRAAHGDQVRPYVPASVAQRIEAGWAGRITAPVLGRPAVYAALARAGQGGLTEGEIVTLLSAGVGMVRVHTRALYLEGQLQRWRVPGRQSPFVYRLACHVDAPPPKRRGQVSAFCAQAAD